MSADPRTAENAEDRPMTAPYQALRDALEAGPTPGPWVRQSRDDGKTDPWWIDTHAYAEGPEPVWAPPQYGVGDEDAAYIAAADPSTIRELLAERDALAAVAEAAEEVDGAWYVEDGCWTYREDAFEPRLTKLRDTLYDRAVSKP